MKASHVKANLMLTICDATFQEDIKARLIKESNKPSFFKQVKLMVC